MKVGGNELGRVGRDLSWVMSWAEKLMAADSGSFQAGLAGDPGGVCVRESSSGSNKAFLFNSYIVLKGISPLECRTCSSIKDIEELVVSSDEERLWVGAIVVIRSCGGLSTAVVMTGKNRAQVTIR